MSWIKSSNERILSKFDTRQYMWLISGDESLNNWMKVKDGSNPLIVANLVRDEFTDKLKTDKYYVRLFVRSFHVMDPSFWVYQDELIVPSDYTDKLLSTHNSMSGYIEETLKWVNKK